MPRRPPVSVHLLPALIPPGALAGGVAVVIDVLRATTSMVHALAAGCDAIRPFVEIDEARKAAEALPDGSALLAGEREGVPIEGFDLANSPSSFTPDLCSGKTLVMTTTNGTKAIHAALGADRVLIAAFVNRTATVDTLEADGRAVHIICSGTDGLVSLEDTMLAGAIAQELDTRAWNDTPIGLEAGPPSDTILANDQAEIASALWREAESMVEDGYTLAESLADGRGGRRCRSLGLGADIEDAARIDRFPFAAELLRDPPRIVPAPDDAGPRLRLFGA